MKKIAIITARGGSKRIPRKNIKEFCGKPILAYSIEAALESGVFDEVMVSFIYLGEPKKLVLCMLSFWYLMTLLLNSVVNIRYAYPVMIAAPFLLAWLFGKIDWKAKV